MSDDAGGSSSQPVRKRARQRASSAEPDPGPGHPPQAKKARYLTTKAAAKNRRDARPAKERIYTHRLLEKDVPVEAKELKNMFYTVVRLMWGMKTSNDVPTLVPADVIAEYERRHTEGHNPVTGPAVTASLPQKNFWDAVANVRAVKTTSKTAAIVARLEDRVPEMLKDACRRYGLSAWRPDFRASPETPYNVVHRIVAEEVFTQLASSHAFASVGVSLKHLNDKPLLRKFFNHYVHHVKRKDWHKELTAPGSVKKEKQLQVAFQRRKQPGQALELPYFRARPASSSRLC